MTGRLVLVCLLTCGGILGIKASEVLAVDPWADAVASYAPGLTAAAGYSATPAVAIGAPERFTGETDFGGAFPSVVSMFSPAFGTDEIVSIGEGGELSVRFDEPVLDLPGHLYGIDLILFSNSGFADFNYPAGQQGSPPFLFGTNFSVARILVSADGSNYVPVSSRADALFPAQGFLDSGPYDSTPGSITSNFLRPMNPVLTAADFAGLSYVQSLALYNGSGGGLPIDIATSGLASISFVRVMIEDDGNPLVDRHVEIDAFAAVPEPTTISLCLIGAYCRRSSNRRCAVRGN